ncbi:MAG: response regulator [Chloroflexaceae bacterium]|nr:response regulator [Chloroflexaceae bacterium]
MNHASTILIVDDESISREAMESLLTNQGYHLVFASTGAEALSLAAQRMPDLILLDIMMPGMDGFEMCRQLRATPLIADIPVIMVTSLDDRDSRLQGIEAGADDFISKPFDRIELRLRVRTITHLNRYRRLMNERTRFEWVIEQAKDGFVIVDRNDTIQYANSQARSYLNLPPPSSEDTADATLPDNEPFLALVRKHYRCEPEEAWQNRLLLHTPHPPKAPDGTVPPVPEVLCYLVRPETATSQALWLQVDHLDLPTSLHEEKLFRMRDVTEQVTRKRQMWTFHSLVTHKLGAPQASLINSIHLLKSGSHHLSPQEVEEFTDIVFQSAQRLCSQIQEVRDYLRMTEQPTPSEAYPLATLPQLIEHIRREMNLEALTVTGGALPDARLVLSAQAIEVLLREVLENARKFHPTYTPTITVAISSTRGSEACIQVTDDGVTLSPEQLDRVWMPYYQAEKGFSGSVPGMGLGLAMVAALLWNVGGHYAMTNREPGPGVVVRLVIPLAKDVAQ